jgi:hypothetical protein
MTSPIIFENQFLGFIGCQDHDYEGFKFVCLKLHIISMSTGLISHLNGHAVTSRFVCPKNNLKFHIKS